MRRRRRIDLSEHLQRWNMSLLCTRATTTSFITITIPIICPYPITERER
jgi:hypothetical protein